DSNNGQVNVNAANDLNLSNTTGNLVIGTINSGGTAVIISVAGIIAGDKPVNNVHVKAKSIELTAQNGSIGTAEAPIDIDTDAENQGTLSAWATNGAININERNGDLIIKTVRSDGNGTVNISAAGGIKIDNLTSTGGGDVTLIAGDGGVTEVDITDALAAATEAKIKAKQARSAADLAAAQVIILQNYVTNILPELLGLPAAQQALDTAVANLTAAQQKLAVIKAQIDQALADLAILQNEKVLADQALADAETALAKAKADREGLTDPAAIAEQDRLINELAQVVEEAQKMADAKQKELDDKNAEIVDLRSQETEMENVTIPELSRLKDEAQNTLHGIEDQLSQAQVDLVDAKATERDNLEAIAQALEAIAATKLAEAQTASSSITTEGNLNIKLLNGGTIGEEDNSLGVTAAGTVTVTAGTGTSVYGLYLESGGDLYLAPVTVDGKVVIDSKGNIKGMPGNTDTIITAANVELSSLGGDIGAASLPLVINVDRLTASGKKVYIKNLKDLTIDTVAGDTVSIETSGNIAAGSAAGGGNNNNIIADQLNLTATGSIGSVDNRLGIDTDQITAGSQDLYLENNSGKLQIDGMNVPGQADIQAAGSVVDGGTRNIQIGNLNISAFGDVGQLGDDLDVTVPGVNRITTNSTYGSVNVKVWYKSSGGSSDSPTSTDRNTVEDDDNVPSKPATNTITDPKTGVTVSGQGIDDTTKLVVTLNTSQGHDPDQIHKFINELAKKGKVLLNYSISVNKSLQGTITVNIPVGTEYEGKTLTVISYQDDEMYVFDVTVKQGMVSFETRTLASYAVLDDQYTIISYDGEYTLSGGQTCPMAAGQFKDVTVDDWFFAAVAYMHALKIMEGVTENMFEPNSAATRSMLAAMLYRLEGSPQVSGNSSFADVEAGTWYADAVNWAESQGIVQGYGNDLFGTNDAITREQLAVFLYRYSMSKGRDISASNDLSGFADADQISDYALEAMEWAVAVGLIKGKGEDNLDPAASVTRAEIAAIMLHYLEIYAKVLLVDDDLM
ncbi:MAG TPA: S-layer homology domain-containing protein, partial [Syntrophomonadaceae bacterium]|nr:S-layer homology domain-containing protein [Syntrophomonadaceae bacterium]